MLKVRKWWLGLGWLAASAGLAACYGYHTLPGETDPTDLNVIFITWDGVRWQEFFHGTDPLQAEVSGRERILNRFWTEVAPRGQVYGNREAGHPVARVSNPTNISLPGYMSMFAGHAVPCFMNDCSRIGAETVVDRMVDELGLAPREIAAFATWRQIALAFTARDGQMTSNVSVQDLVDGTDDPELAELNEMQRTDLPPWHGGPHSCGGVAGTEPPGPDSLRPAFSSRWDKYTWAQAMRYLRVHQPRFMYVGLGDTDEYGHLDQYPGYLNALRDNDERIAELMETLDSLGDYGRRTAVILTTDHGRGVASQWGWHGTPAFPGAERIFMTIIPAREGSRRFEALPAETTAAQHADIRPTIEEFLGIGQVSCSDCGRPLVRPVEDEGAARETWWSRTWARLWFHGRRVLAQTLDGADERRLSLALGNPRGEVVERARESARQLADPRGQDLAEAVGQFPELRRYLDVTFAFSSGYPDRWALCVGAYPLPELEIEACAASTLVLTSLALTAKWRWDLIHLRNRSSGMGHQLTLGPGAGYRHLDWCGGGACAPSDGFDVVLSLQYTLWLAQHFGVNLELDGGLGFQWIEEFAGFRDFYLVPEGRAMVGFSF